MRRLLGFMMGIMVGALVGATVALLFAPDSGAELRDALRARGENLVADIRHAAEVRRIELTNQLESFKESRPS